ncbi:MAG: class I SAM-dependent RNA methyltransferase, partial [Treponema sp.]|nr:class I SAM-dependent RNA methyltransferase [Treponema sp.]
KQIHKDCFEREGIKVPEITVLESSPLNYRARIQLTDGGFCKKSSNEIIRLDNCPVATDEINAYLKSTPQNERPRGRVHLFGDSRITGDKNTFIADEITSGAKDQRKTYRKNSGKIIKNRIPNHFAGTVFSPQNTCELKLLDKNVKFNVQGFFQSNMQLLEKTIAEVTYNLSGKNVLDMYAGSGTFSVFLADKFEKTTLVEHNRDALVYAEANMNGKNHETYGLSGEKWCKEHASLLIGRNGPFDAAVIDPPRSGMEKEVCRWLCSSKVFQLRSVSCDPATHARDAYFLIKSGYTLKRLYLLDFYPQTSHIESLAYFENEN